MKLGFKSALALLMAAGMLAIVISPFVDLPLTVQTKTHQLGTHILHAAAFVPPSMMAVPSPVAFGDNPGAGTRPPGADLMAITCAFLC